jgi:hypothetical protein
MLSHNVNLEFIGFDPKCEVRRYISSVTDRLHSLAPSDSFMKVAMKKGVDAVEATCKIASQAGEFVAEAVDNNPVKAIYQIEYTIKQQLDEWKKCRFGVQPPEVATSRTQLNLAS